MPVAYGESQSPQPDSSGCNWSYGECGCKVSFNQCEKVRVVGRNHDRLKEFVAAGAEPFTADLSDAACRQGSCGCQGCIRDDPSQSLQPRRSGLSRTCGGRDCVGSPCVPISAAPMSRVAIVGSSAIFDDIPSWMKASEFGGDACSRSEQNRCRQAGQNRPGRGVALP
jgi:hypothetical protein